MSKEAEYNLNRIIGKGIKKPDSGILISGSEKKVDIVIENNVLTASHDGTNVTIDLDQVDVYHEEANRKNNTRFTFICKRENGTCMLKNGKKKYWEKKFVIENSDPTCHYLLNKSQNINHKISEIEQNIVKQLKKPSLEDAECQSLIRDNIMLHDLKLNKKNVSLYTKEIYEQEYNDYSINIRNKCDTYLQKKNKNRSTGNYGTADAIANTIANVGTEGLFNGFFSGGKKPTKKQTKKTTKKTTKKPTKKPTKKLKTCTAKSKTTGKRCKRKTLHKKCFQHKNKK